jgi:DNA-directed RNA polymerase subunit E'/Rpb7
MIITVNQKVSIEPKYLHQDIEYFILEKIKNKSIGQCSLENGYILDVIDIKNIGENIIETTNSLIVFDVEYLADVLKPAIGDINIGKVCMIFEYGIFVNVFGIMKILIPKKSIVDYDYEDKKFVSKDGKDDILIDTDLQIEIIMIKYEKKQFSCIGKIKK